MGKSAASLLMPGTAADSKRQVLCVSLKARIVRGLYDLWLWLLVMSWPLRVWVSGWCSSSGSASQHVCGNSRRHAAARDSSPKVMLEKVRDGDGSISDISVCNLQLGGLRAG